MKKENLIILGVLLVGIYFYFNKKKKDLNEPYSDAELNKKLNDLYDKSQNYLVKKGGNKGGIKTKEQVVTSTKDIFVNAKIQGKDISKATVDKVLNLLWITSINQEGDSSQGTVSKEDFDFLMKYVERPQPERYAVGLSSQPKVTEAIKTIKLEK
jgi:hypothetical protein